MAIVADAQNLRRLQSALDELQAICIAVPPFDPRYLDMGLVEANYFAHQASPSPEQIDFWLLEMRTPELLASVASEHARRAERLATQRPLLRQAKSGNTEVLAAQLWEEERAERNADREYWKPLREQLQKLRQAARDDSDRQ